MSVTKDPEANWAATFVASLELAKQGEVVLGQGGGNYPCRPRPGSLSTVTIYPRVGAGLLGSGVRTVPAPAQVGQVTRLPPTISMPG